MAARPQTFIPAIILYFLWKKFWGSWSCQGQDNSPCLRCRKYVFKSYSPCRRNQNTDVTLSEIFSTAVFFFVYKMATPTQLSFSTINRHIFLKNTCLWKKTTKQLLILKIILWPKKISLHSGCSNCGEKQPAQKHWAWTKFYWFVIKKKECKVLTARRLLFWLQRDP